METVLTDARVGTADEEFGGTVVIKDGVIFDIKKADAKPPVPKMWTAIISFPVLLICIRMRWRSRCCRGRTYLGTRSPPPSPMMRTRPLRQSSMVFGSLAAGASVAHPERNETLKLMIDSLHRTQEMDLLCGEHFVHLRCEVTDPMVMELFHDVIDHPSIRFMSVNDHAPGHRQYPDMDYYREKHIKNCGLNDKEMDDIVALIQEQSQKFGPERRAELVPMAQSRKIPAASHDDRTAEEGMMVAEFPITFEAIGFARERGLKVLAGGPNLCRGSSHHPGNLLTDDEFRFSMPAAIPIGWKNPATFADLTDHGEIAASKRADLAQVKNVDGIPAAGRVWVKGERGA